MPKINIPKSELNKVKNSIQQKYIKNLSDKDKDQARQYIKDSLFSIIKIEIKKGRDIQLVLEHEGKVYRQEYKQSQELIQYLIKFFDGINR